MINVITAWLASMLDNAPYLVGAVIAIWAQWRELRECHLRLFDYLEERREND